MADKVDMTTATSEPMLLPAGVVGATPPGSGAPIGMTPPPPRPGLSPQQIAELQEAKLRRKKIDKAAGVAAFGGWCTAVFAVCTALILPLSFSFAALFIGIGLATVAFFEFRGRRMLKSLDARAPKLLGWNQLFFLAVITIYCVWSLIDLYVNPTDTERLAVQYPEIKDMLGDVGQTVRLLGTIVYVTVIIASIGFQGGTALYYFTRGKHLRAYIEKTPQWVIDAQRAGV